MRMELDCIDCHTSTEAMGDGDLYSGRLDIQYSVQDLLQHVDRTAANSHIHRPNDVELRRARLNATMIYRWPSPCRVSA